MKIKLPLIVIAVLVFVVLSNGIGFCDQNIKNDSTFVSQPITPPQIDTSGFEVIIRLVISVIIITVLVYFSIWGLKKLSSYKPGQRKLSGNIEILDNSYIGPKKSLHIVKAGKKHILIGSCENSLSLLCELNPEDFETLNTGSPSINGQGSKFRDMLEKFKAGVEKPFLRRMGKVENVS
ncbi:MAG: flagellar biosynthetic protein FliO [candidate division Zixibacteria bacterium]|nr:flagellar biosynthetic protein FliO [candidate division Zixibacteria bacterium]